MAILGLAGFDHNGSATLLDEDRVLFLEAERAMRSKNIGLSSPGVLEATLAALPDLGIDEVALGDLAFIREHADWLEPWLRDHLPGRPVRRFAHHDCHLASAFWSSGWDEALVVSIDGKGDGLSASAAVMDRRGRHDRLLAVPSASSLGRAWWAATVACGLGGHHGAGKTMAWAAFGSPRHLPELRGHLALGEDGGFAFLPPDDDPLRFRNVPRFAEWLLGLEGAEPAEAGPRLPDLAASVQALTEEVMLHLVGTLVRRSGLRRLCLAGGVALNGLANQRLLAKGVVDALHVPPFPDDRGLSFGAAALAARDWGIPLPPTRIEPFLGPEAAAHRAPEGWAPLKGGAVERVADLILAGALVASVQGCDEAGPRALGNRSILATPVLAELRERLNREVKGREPFRPFGCSILADRAGDWLEMDGDSPYMLRIVAMRPERRGRIPAVVHADGTTRPQTVDATSHPALNALLEALERRGHPPLVLNTSLNGRGEPICHAPQDAFAMAERLGIDAIWTGDRVYVRSGRTPMSSGR